MARVPNISTATPTSSSTVLGETAGVVRRFAVGDLGLRRTGTTASRPALTAADNGTMYLDTTLAKPVWYLHPNWVDATGASV